jgi:hypothetical protein
MSKTKAKKKSGLGKIALLKALRQSGLPYTMPNFVMKYERMICDIEGCPYEGMPFLTSPRDHNDDRTYTKQQIEEICFLAKMGWFDVPRHFHWFPGIKIKF